MFQWNSLSFLFHAEKPVQAENRPELFCNHQGDAGNLLRIKTFFRCLRLKDCKWQVMSGKKTLVIGASTNRSRYAYLAVNKLLDKGHEVIPLGIEQGHINGIPIETERKPFNDVDTVTLYINPVIQKEYYDYILNTIKPGRIIFNPGTENREFKKLAATKGIETMEACTLVLLSTGQF